MLSSPPECRSIVSPSASRAIALHSMCQPGYPAPTPSKSHFILCAGSTFHNRKSAACRLADWFAADTRPPAPVRSASSVFPDSRPYSGNRCTSKYTAVPAAPGEPTTYAAPFDNNSRIIACICAIFPVGRGISSGFASASSATFSPRSRASARNTSA